MKKLVLTMAIGLIGAFIVTGCKSDTIEIADPPTINADDLLEKAKKTEEQERTTEAVPEITEESVEESIPEVVEKETVVLTGKTEEATETAEAAPVDKEASTPNASESEFTETYVEVNITTQTMTLYTDYGNNVVVSSPCVTGNADGVHNTPAGMHRIMNMSKNARLQGPTWDCVVSRWMKFTSDGCGLHDATWRDASEFGGSTYQGNGSHGCVNLPLDVATTIYDYLSVGDVVYVHD